MCIFTVHIIYIYKNIYSTFAFHYRILWLQKHYVESDRLQPCSHAPCDGSEVQEEAVQEVWWENQT
jgi:hypothetical protein